MKRKPPKPQNFSASQIADIQQAVFALIDQSLDAERFYLLNVDFEKESGQWYLRIYAEGKGFRISLSDCETISRQLDEAIEALPALKDVSYSLEVSSPGLFRPLKTAREFSFYQGQAVLVEEYSEAAAGQKLKKVGPARVIKGILAGYDETQQQAAVKLIEKDTTQQIPMDASHRILLNPDIKIPDEEEPTI